MYDYRELQGKADYRQKQVEEITAKADLTDSDRDRVQSLMGEIRALEETAGELRDAEIKELREIVARANTIPGATDRHAQEIADLLEVVRKNNPIFGLATVFNLTGDTTMSLPIKSAHGAATTAAEAGARAEQNAPGFVGPSLTCYDYFSDQRATQTELDCVTGLEDMLLGWIYDDIVEQAEYDATVGDGQVKGKGLFAHTGGTSTDFGLDQSGSADALNNTCWLTTYFKLPIKYRKKAVWVIYGKKVVESDSAPAIGNGLYPVAFGDIAQAMAVGIHRVPSVLRDPYTAAPKVRFYGLGRLGAAAWNYEACRLIKSDNA
jgi:predicted phage gp36 major capsid-like protein